MAKLDQDAEQGEDAGGPERKIRLLLDSLHGEEDQLYLYDKLAALLSARCEVTVLKKKPLAPDMLSKNNAFVLVSPNKTWEESEIETVRRYVEHEGGVLLALTVDGRKPDHLNKLLELAGLSLIPGTVEDKYLDTEGLQRSQLLEGVKSLALGDVWGNKSTRIAASSEAELVLCLTYKDATIGAKRNLGKGAVYLFSCLPVLGNKQLGQMDNSRFLDNLLKSLRTPQAMLTAQVDDLQRQPEPVDVGEAQVPQGRSGGSGFLVPWEGKFCVSCIYNVDYRRFESSMSIAHISPIATGHDICALRWAVARDPCKYYCKRLEAGGPRDIDLSSARPVVLRLNDEVGLQRLRLLEQAETPLNLIMLQEFLLSRGYRIQGDQICNRCIEYYGSQPRRLLPRDYWSHQHRQTACTVLALEFVGEHNGCQVSDIERYCSSVDWAKEPEVKPQIETLRKRDFVTTDPEPRRLRGLDPTTRVEIARVGSDSLDSLRETAQRVLKFVEERKACQVPELKKYWEEACSDVIHTFTVLGLGHSELNWHLPMLAPMVWKEYLDVVEKSPHRAMFSDDNVVMVTAKGQQQCREMGYLPLRSLYT
jgi:hypothetical protein